MTRVKICGLTNLEDATVAAEAGADMLGFIFHEKSPRYVNRETVAAITESLRGLDIDRMPLFVGVFVSPTPDDVAATLEQCWLQAAQIHHMEDKLYREVQAKTGDAAYPTIQIAPDDSLASSVRRIDYLNRPPPWLPNVLIDAYHPKLAGGTGQMANLEIIKEFVELADIMLAGGLTPTNVAETIQAVRPWAVDVSSGVESTPGKKDHGKVRAFIQTVREVDRQLANKEQTE